MRILLLMVVMYYSCVLPQAFLAEKKIEKDRILMRKSIFRAVLVFVVFYLPLHLVGVSLRLDWLLLAVIGVVCGLLGAWAGKRLIRYENKRDYGRDLAVFSWPLRHRVPYQLPAVSRGPGLWGTQCDVYCFLLFSANDHCGVYDTGHRGLLGLAVSLVFAEKKTPLRRNRTNFMTLPQAESILFSACGYSLRYGAHHAPALA